MAKSNIASKFSFIYSTRFQAVVVIGITIFAFDQGWITEELRNFLFLVLGGHTGIRTIDRFGEKIGGK